MQKQGNIKNFRNKGATGPAAERMRAVGETLKEKNFLNSVLVLSRGGLGAVLTSQIPVMAVFFALGTSVA
jgi:hypothetical protein